MGFDSLMTVVAHRLKSQKNLSKGRRSQPRILIFCEVIGDRLCGVERMEDARSLPAAVVLFLAGLCREHLVVGAQLRYCYEQTEDRSLEPARFVTTLSLTRRLD